MTTTITGAQALEAIRKAVELRGEEFVYPEEWRTSKGMCKYVHEGEPACIVGVALDSLGVRIKGRPNSSVGDIHRLASWRDVELTREAQSILVFAQLTQDGRQTWGEALTAAERALK